MVTHKEQLPKPSIYRQQGHNRARVIHGRSGRVTREQTRTRKGYTGVGTSRQAGDPKQNQEHDQEQSTGTRFTEPQGHVGRTQRQGGLAQKGLNILPASSLR